MKMHLILSVFYPTVNEATDEFDAGGGGEEFRPADEGEILSRLWFVSHISDCRKATYWFYFFLLFEAVK